MSDVKHTPGPWGIEQTENHNWIGPLRNKSHKVWEIVCSTERGPLKPDALERSDANAHLIAAAPDLLEACKAALWAGIKDIDGEPDLVRAAIAKAEGTQSTT
jgi:hypothetical protein